MNKYVNIEVAKEYLRHDSFDNPYFRSQACQQAINVLDTVPAADVVEASSVVKIVHCKECKFGEWNAVECAYWCQGRFRRPDWYCADAESKDGGQDDGLDTGV